MAACAVEAAAARRRVRGCGWRIVVVLFARARKVWLCAVVDGCGSSWDFLSARTLELLVCRSEGGVCGWDGLYV